MADNTSDTPNPTIATVPPAVPWIQALCVVALVVVFAIDTLNPQVSAPATLYVIIGGIAVGLGPKAIYDALKR